MTANQSQEIRADSLSIRAQKKVKGIIDKKSAEIKPNYRTFSSFRKISQIGFFRHSGGGWNPVFSHFKNLWTAVLVRPRRVHRSDGILEKSILIYRRDVFSYLVSGSSSVLITDRN
jgi:hypothetical protein